MNETGGKKKKTHTHTHTFVFWVSGKFEIIKMEKYPAGQIAVIELMAKKFFSCNICPLAK